jgi:hypothetical protein
MNLKIADKESKHLNEYLGISATRVVELSAEMAKEVYYYLSKVNFGFKVNDDYSNLENDLLRRVMIHANNTEEAIFMATIFDKLLQGALSIDVNKLKEERINFLSKNN